MTPSAEVFPTPEGTQWKDIRIEIVSRDSARIKVGSVTLTYTAFDMGFRDGRQRDLLNKQWDLLLIFAEYNGVLSWASPKAKTGLYKRVQILKATLCQFFQLADPPIKNYKKGVGYVAMFRITDLSCGKG